MKVKRNHRFAPEVITASLNDIMFFLLLFFLIIATVANPNVIKILLPKAESSQALSKQQISLTVTAARQYYLDKTEVPFAQLEQALRTAVADIAEPTVVLRVDQSLNVQDLVDVMELGAKLKIKMVLATQNGNG